MDRLLLLLKDRAEGALFCGIGISELLFETSYPHSNILFFSIQPSLP